jgi:hypothetical protein
MLEAVIVPTFLILAGILGPLAIGDIFFKKPGREVADAVCTVVSATIWTGVWIFCLIVSTSQGDSFTIVTLSFIVAFSLVIYAATYALLITEIKKRRRVATETLF